ncbi:DUF4279 domain-containing protein [Nocardia suismassiliense]|uniref:DUF4279 domain-containing protein n=1 Tax=Nocardia suismassiliense TaxID=2077092 RepID=UPI000D1F4910|nr:DUF4279 domain-containing protein [Nocardia suismassiliense]
MKVRQYCYFAVKSEVVSAAEVGAWLGMDADAVLVMGSKSAERRIPRCHSWKIIERDAGCSADGIGDQIQRLVERLSPVRDRLIELTARDEVSSVLQVVRYFGDPDGVSGAPDGSSPEQAGQWSRPFGWHLSMAVLEFLSATGTELDVDEYDFSDDSDG